MHLKLTYYYNEKIKWLPLKYPVLNELVMKSKSFQTQANMGFPLFKPRKDLNLI